MQRPMRLRFTIRDLILATIIVALAIGWSMDHWRTQARSAEIKRELEMIKGGIDVLETHEGGTVTIKMKRK